MKVTILEGDRAGEFRPQPAGRRIGFQRPVQHRRRLADRAADLLEVLDQPRQADQRLRDPLLTAS